MQLHAKLCPASSALALACGWRVNADIAPTERGITAGMHACVVHPSCITLLGSCGDMCPGCNWYYCILVPIHTVLQVHALITNLALQQSRHSHRKPLPEKSPHPLGGALKVLFSRTGTHQHHVDVPGLYGTALSSALPTMQQKLVRSQQWIL